MEAPRFIGPRFLICEGIDDKLFLTALIKTHNLPDFQVCHAAEFNGWGEDEEATGGKDGIPKSLKRIDVLTGFDQLKAVLVVTDNDHEKAWRLLRKSLKCICTLPETCAGVGTIYGKPLVVFMIPSADKYGDLETFCLPEIHRKWPRSPECVEEFLANTRATITWTKQSSLHKARARAAIVGFYEPDPYMGIGYLFQKGALNTDNVCFRPLIDFLSGFDAFVGITGD